jgi:hypothetical protein
VYVVGGYDGSYLQSVERLDPREGKWQLVRVGGVGGGRASGSW